jgi:hypothetical protein
VRKRGKVLVVVASILAVAFAAVLVVYVFPPRGTPARDPDVVMVVGPADQWRIDWAQQLRGSHAALAISVGLEEHHPECAETGVICFHAEPYTTQGEARELRTLMHDHRWTTATVVTMTPHLLRTQMRMDWCVPHGVTVVGRSTGLSPGDWIYQFAYQTAGFAKALLVTRGC